jgi:flavin-dependent dehydrogenase
MPHKYDLVIVGAGPGGAMAAKTAGENGLKTLVLERKTNPAAVKRGDSQIFASESHFSSTEKVRFFGERAYYNFDNQKIVFPVNGFSVDYDGPIRKIYAWHIYAPDGKARLAFGNYEENVKKGRFFFTMDKGRAIDLLLKDAVKNRAEVLTGVNVNGIEKTKEGVKVTANGDSYEGTFVVGADGINSRIAELMGFNKERIFFRHGAAQFFYFTGFKMPQSEAIIVPTYFKPNAVLPTSCFIVPSPYAEDEYWMGSRDRAELEYVIKESIYSSWFSDVKVREVQSAVINLWSPVSEPYKDNVLLVGDSAYFNEAEIIGSMMCGWKAANAVTVALKDNKPDREGVLDYIEWWKKSYLEWDDYRNFQLLTPFRLIFSKEELIYLFSLIKDPLPTPSPFKIVRLFKQALEPMMSQIKEEMPSALEKLEMLEIDKIDKILLYLKNKMSQ